MQMPDTVKVALRYLSHPLRLQGRTQDKWDTYSFLGGQWEPGQDVPVHLK